MKISPLVSVGFSQLLLAYPVRRTLPLSGRQGAIAIEADSTVACPLEGLVRHSILPCIASCQLTPPSAEPIESAVAGPQSPRQEKSEIDI